jgi:hypothetical protein
MTAHAMISIRETRDKACDMSLAKLVILFSSLILQRARCHGLCEWTQRTPSRVHQRVVDFAQRRRLVAGGQCARDAGNRMPQHERLRLRQRLWCLPVPGTGLTWRSSCSTNLSDCFAATNTG